MAKIMDSKVLLTRDFASMMEWAIDKIPKITSEWTDFTITSPDMIWLSAVCYSYDMLNYTLDRKFLNNQIRFSRSFDNILNMCTLRGVTLSGDISAKTLLNLNFDTTDLSPTDTVQLLKDTTFEVFDSVTLKTLILTVFEDKTLFSGNNTVTCYEGTRQTETILPDDFSSVGTYILSSKNIATNTITVKVGADYWRYVDDAILVTDTTPSFSVHVYTNGYTSLKLSPGFLAELGSNSVEVSFLVTNGSGGNLGSFIEITPSVKIKDVNNKDVTNKITIEVTRSWGGADALGLEESRDLLGTTSSDVLTLVTEEDYEELVVQQEFVYSSTVKDLNGTKLIYYIADEYIGDYDITNTILINSITEAVLKRVPVFTQIEVYPINFRPVSLEIKVYLNRNELDLSGLQADIEALIQSSFGREHVYAGMELSRTSLATMIENLGGSIGHVLIAYPFIDITCAWNETLVIDSLSISFERG